MPQVDSWGVTDENEQDGGTETPIDSPRTHDATTLDKNRIDKLDMGSSGVAGDLVRGGAGGAVGEGEMTGAQAAILSFPVRGRKAEGQPLRPGAQKAQKTGAHAPQGVTAKPRKSLRPRAEDETRPPVPEGTSTLWYAVEREGKGWKFRKRWIEQQGGATINRTLYLFRIGGGAWRRMKERYTYEQIRTILADKIQRQERVAARRRA